MIAVCVGAVWLAVLIGFYAERDGSFYRYRDDGMITLSAARGLTDVGTVSVGVSGSRVEPSSSPLQLGLAAAFYTAGGSGYETFFDAELALFTVLLGASVFLVLRVGAPRKPIGPVGLAAAAVSLPLFSTYAFFGWHSSGMESPVANSLAAITVGLLALSMRNRRWLVVAGIAAGLFAISRVEFVVHAAPLLLVAAIYLRARGGTLREMASLLTPAVVIWVAVLAIRFTYFGSLTPNSALEPFTADPLSPGASLAAWAKPALPIAIAVAYFVIRLFKRGSSSASAIVRSPSFIAVALIGAIASVLLAVRLASSDALPNVDAVRDSFHALGLGGWLFVAAALIALVGLRHLNIVAILLGTQVLTGVGSILIFGGARLSPERVVTFVLVPLLSLIALQLLYVDARSFRIRGIGVHRATVVSVAIVALLGGTGWLFSTRDAIVSTRELCCDRTRVSSRVLATAAQLRRDTGLPTVSVASADLGYLSLQKAVNVTDLGWLGDPVLTKLWHEGNVTGTHRAAVTYLNDYVVPDVVELHPGWACTYANWQRSKAFQTRYRLVWDDAQTADWLNSSCPGAVGLKGGIWVRRDLSDGRANREAALSRVLARSPSPRRVRKELSTCMAAGQSDACQYVARSVYRNLRAFEDAGTLDETRRAFLRSPSAEYDQALLNSRHQANWSDEASHFLRLQRRY